ncbi:DUF6705 family protein [Chryseobacterium echinoideorum]|uniref:DUF6705 family protein n=1 Tax=Chryseobacterium echinoideorum TaxID=1549648 RepID=UPI001186167D|nr:DUF6705 family protein [Chryseobacterium echinoideorum]
MKNIISLTILLLSISCKAQIYPLNTSPSNIPDNAYIKDTNNELDKYVGVWKGSWNGKTLYLELRKIKYYSQMGRYYSDQIFGERKIINSTGIVEIDRITNFNNEGPEFRGIFNSLKYPGKKMIYFSPKNMCRKTASLHITDFDEINHKMTLKFIYDPSYIDESCPYFNSVMQGNDFPVNFPRDIVLTKQ